MNAPEERFVVVTGASSGIGRACAMRLARSGIRVFAGVRRRADGDSLRAEAPDGVEPLLLDVTDAGSLAAAREVVSDATHGRLLGLVNNAGIAVGGPVETVPLDDLRRQFEVNVIGQVAVTQAFLPMLRAARGRVAFMSSIGGRVAVAFVAPYDASKHAIEAIGDALRQELKPLGVHVALIEPGSVATPIWHKGLAEIERARSSLTPETLRLYGHAVDRFEAIARHFAEHGADVQPVAEAVEHALTARRPRTRYVVGNAARVQAAVRRLAPDRVMDRVLARATGL